MAQIFKPYANTIASASVMLGAVLPFGLLIGGSLITRSPSNTKATVPIDQPVPFSHKHHTQELGIDCRYCHNTVEEQANAGVPATEVCMSCHSQIWTNSPMIEPVRDSHATGKPIQWVKVNVLPDFVYFDHSIHIKRGISCNTCHGPVQEMPITAKGKAFSMAWCVDCHMDPSRFLGEFGAKDNSSHDEHGHGGANMMSPSEQVFALYHKISAGEKLDDNEWHIAKGHMQSAPKDETHEQMIKRLEERNINVSQLKDCWVCHR
ncbi:cytochrome c3 family protein [Kamptonema cortianum]|nr:cytochrome c3 family protein [Kamptonema cortianum]